LDAWEKNAQAEYNYYGFNPEIKPIKIGSERVNLEDLDISPIGSDNEEFWNQIHRRTQPRNKTPTLWEEEEDNNNNLQNTLLNQVN
jgi:hypothetical protein